MLSWLEGFLDSIASHIPAPIRSALGIASSAIAGVLGLLSGNVAAAWRDFAGVAEALHAATGIFTGAILKQLEAIITHWIPKYAITAWWWITHPDQFAEQLVFFLARQLERYAWTLAKYLGEFTLALLYRNLRHVAALAEQIIAAVL